MHSITLLANLALLLEPLLATPGVVPMQMERNPMKHQGALQMRSLTKRGPFTADLNNYPFIGGGFYFVNVTVGTPPQTVQLDIDTGSSDVWMFGAPEMGAGGFFDEQSSSSLTLISQGSFQIQYQTQGSGVTGDYITDVFNIGGQSIRNLTMGVAQQASSVPTGIMGIGYDTNEASVSQGGNQYPNLVDVMVSQGLIQVRSYSLYLDDLEANTGSVLFGGIDSAKYQGQLSVLPIQPDSQSGTISTFSVIWNSVGVTDKSGSTVLTTSGAPNAVVLDSGTALTIVPQDVFQELANYFSATQDSDEGWLVYCDLNGQAGTLDYQFGSSTGPVISVPFEELAIPLVHDDGSPVTYKKRPICKFGLDAQSGDEPFLFGDTFLRSAYVAYDLDAQQIGIAQTLFNDTNSNVQPITAGRGQNLPGSMVSGSTTIRQTATALLPGAAGETASITPGGGDFSSALPSGSAVGQLTGYKTTYTNRATNIPGSTATATGKSAAGLELAPSRMDAIVIGALWSVGLMFLGASFVL